MLKKKYYDGFTVHDILSKHLDDGHKILELLTAFADADGVDAVPVRHGKWIIRDNPGTGWYRVTCSECGEDVTSTAPCIGFFPNAKVTWDYCPSCGARMDEERKEE